MIIDRLKIWECCVEAASVAGELAHTIRLEGGMECFTKPDNSPVTNADYAADQVITQRLTEAFPHIPLISEEGTWETPVMHPDDDYFLVDPLDATRNYIQGKDEYTVNISLMKGYTAVMGLIYAPAIHTLWSAIEGGGAYHQAPDGTPTRLFVGGTPKNGVRALAGSQSAMKSLAKWEEYAEGFPITDTQTMSSAIKFGFIAGGHADLYLRFGTTCAWDTSAGQLLVEEAGGRMETLTGERFLYNTPSFINKGFVVKGW